jgi:hypothetical protein
MEWSKLLWRAWPFFLSFALIWVLYYKFKLLRLVYMATSSTVILAYLWLYGMIGSHGRYLLHKVYYTVGDSHVSALPEDAGGIFLAFLYLVMLGSPYIFLFIFLYIGWSKSCPKCSKGSGFFSRRLLSREFIEQFSGSYSESYILYTEKTRDYNNPNLVNIKHTYGERTVNYTKAKYKIYCKCSSCSHEWSFEEYKNVNK